jgi:hypothetical protein
MITRLLVLAMVLAITLAVTTPALARNDIVTAKPIPGHPDFAITDQGHLVEGGDVVLPKCSTLLKHSDEFSKYGFYEDAAKACKAAEHSSSLTKTGGLPVILVPIALLVVGGFLIRKSTAL